MKYSLTAIFMICTLFFSYSTVSAQESIRNQIMQLTQQLLYLQNLLQSWQDTNSNYYSIGQDVVLGNNVQVYFIPGRIGIYIAGSNKMAVILDGPQNYNDSIWWMVRIGAEVIGWVREEDFSMQSISANQDNVWSELIENISSNDVENPSIKKETDSVRSRFGLVIGPNMNNAFVDRLDFGSWYYTYSPNPDHVTNQIYTFDWSIKNNVEFVPMVHSQKFVFPDRSTCSLVGSNNVCTIEQITDSLNNLKNRYKNAGGIVPQYLRGFNEPGLRREFDDITESVNAWVLLQDAAESADLTLVSPTAGIADDMKRWFVDFLVECHRNVRCDIEKIEVISVHGYKCTNEYWIDQLSAENGIFKRDLIERLERRSPGFDWSRYIMSLPVWITETTCNHDDDFSRFQQNSAYVRSNGLTCRRATGVSEGYGTFEALLSLSNKEVERIAWWTTYANPITNTDVGVINESSRNRISAARLLDDNGNLTSIGEAYRYLSLFSKNPDGLNICPSPTPPTCTITANRTRVPSTGAEVTFSWSIEGGVAGASLWGAGRGAGANPFRGKHNSHTMLVRPKNQILEVWGPEGESLCSVRIQAQ